MSLAAFHCNCGVGRRMSPKTALAAQPELPLHPPIHSSRASPPKGHEMLRDRLRRVLVLVLLATLVCPQPAAAYSVLSHEELIDLAWDRSIAPLLRAKYPQATTEEIKAAEAYAYGGSVIQDLGYYPFGSKFFSDLAH